MLQEKKERDLFTHKNSEISIPNTNVQRDRCTVPSLSLDQKM